MAQEAERQLAQLAQLSCKNLKGLLERHNVAFEGVVEKEELIRLARHALTNEVEGGQPTDGKDPTARGYSPGARTVVAGAFSRVFTVVGTVQCLCIECKS